jgi:hypothetical protein
LLTKEFTNLSKVIKGEKLERLDILHNQITENSLKNLAMLIVLNPNLEKLSVNHNNITSIDLSILKNPIADSSLRYLNIVLGNKIENLPKELKAIERSFSDTNSKISELYRDLIPLKSAMSSFSKLDFKKYNLTKEEESNLFKYYLKKIRDYEVKSNIYISKEDNIILSIRDSNTTFSKDSKNNYHNDQNDSDFIFYKGAPLIGNLVASKNVKTEVIEAKCGYIKLNMLATKKDNSHSSNEEDYDYYINIMQGAYLFKLISFEVFVNTLKCFTDIEEAIEDINLAELISNGITISVLKNNLIYKTIYKTKENNENYNSLVKSLEESKSIDIKFNFSENFTESPILGDSFLYDGE